MNKIIDAIGSIDDALIEDALGYKICRNSYHRRRILTGSLIAASLVIVISIAPFAMKYLGVTQQNPIQSSTVKKLSGTELSPEEVYADDAFGIYYPQYIPSQYEIKNHILKNTNDPDILLWAEYTGGSAEHTESLHIMLLPKSVFYKNREDDPEMTLNECKYYGSGVDDGTTQVFVDCDEYVAAFDISGDKTKDPDFLKMIYSAEYFAE